MNNFIHYWKENNFLKHNMIWNVHKYVWPQFWIWSESVSVTTYCPMPLGRQGQPTGCRGSTALCCGSLLWGCVSADCCCSLALPGSCYLLGVMACEDIPGGPIIFYGFLMNLKQNWKKWCRTTSWVYSSSFFQLMLDWRWVFWKIPLIALVYFPFLRTY